jgi:hypothetical protein
VGNVDATTTMLEIEVSNQLISLASREFLL